MAAFANAHLIYSTYDSAVTTNTNTMIHKRGLDGGGVGIVLIMLVVGICFGVAFVIRCVKQRQARYRERRAGRANRGDAPLAQRSRRTKGRNHTAPQEPIGLGISGTHQDLEAGPEPEPEPELPTQPPPSYHTNSLRNQRSNRQGVGLANRTMRTGSNRSNRSRPQQSINQYLQSRRASGSSTESWERASAGETAAQEHHVSDRGAVAAARAA